MLLLGIVICIVCGAAIISACMLAGRIDRRS